MTAAANGQPNPVDRVRQLLFQGLVRPYLGLVQVPDPAEDIPPAAEVPRVGRSSGPDRETLFRHLAPLSTDAAFSDAHTVVILTDTRPSTHKDLEFMQHTLRLLVERCALAHQEKWTVLFVPLNLATGLEQVQYTWGGTYVLEMLAALFPDKHYILMDNDAAATTLWEVHELKSLAARLGFPGRTFCHAFSEHVSYVNAGIMVFPSLYRTEGRLAGERPVTSYQDFCEYQLQALRRIMNPMPEDPADRAEERFGFLHTMQGEWARRPFHGTPLEYVDVQNRF